MTIQVPDNLIIASVQWRNYFSSFLPETHPGIRRATDEEYERSEVEVTTACRRGYIATYLIKDRGLYLANIRGVYVKESAEPIFANWVTETTAVPLGPILVDCGTLPSLHDQELRIEIKEGRVLTSNLVDYKKTCPDWLSETSYRKRTMFTLMGSNQDSTVSIPQLQQVLGDIEQRSPPRKWWEKSFAHKRRAANKRKRP